MQFTNISRKKSVFLALTSVFLFLHFSSSHPTNGGGGYTSAPGDQTCLNCHNTGSINGDIQLTGIPALVTPGDTYPITVTINNTVGTASRAGFQMVALNTDMPPIVSVGTFSIPAGGSNLQIKQANNKSYIGHSPAKTFGGNTSLTYDIEWTAPTDQDGEEVKFYGASILANGSGTSGDRFLVTNTTTMIEGGTSTPIVLDIQNIFGIQCNGDENGEATVIVTGGTPNYTYAWDNGEDTATATMLSAGNHTVTVTDMAGQFESISVDIPDTDLLTAGIVSETDALCNGDSNGTAEIQGQGGTGNFLFDWSNGLSGPLQNNLEAGSYIISVTDGNDCQVTVNLDIDEPAAILLDVVGSIDPTCSDSDDGSIEVAATGGFGNITYTWSPNLGNQLGGEVSNIPEGDYMVTALDQNNCSTSTTISLFGPSAVTATFTNVVNETCAMDQDGGATVVPGGGAGNYTVTWSNGSTSLSQTNLAGGVYTVTVSDSNGCTADASVTIENGSTLDIDINIIEQPACGNTNGALEVVVLNTTNPPTYLWNVGSTTAIVGNLGSGMYSVTATDGLCSQFAEIDLVEINNLEVEVASVVNVTCNGVMNGGAALNITGGMSPYDVEWSDGGTETSRNDLSGGSYTVSISDSQGCMDMVMIDITEPDELVVASGMITPTGCGTMSMGSIVINMAGGTMPYAYNWSNGETTSLIENLMAGTYSCTITDANSCTEVYEGEVTSGASLLATAVFTNITCFGESDGSIDVDVSNGVSPYAILWSDGMGEDEFSRTGLATGTYSFTVTDALECTVSFTNEIFSQDELTANGSTTNETGEGLNDGTASVNPLGGTQPYQVEWSTGAVTLSITDLEPGNYSATVTDANGCVVTESLTVQSFGCDLDGIVSATNVICFGESNGSVNVEPFDGTAPYTILWSTGDTTNQVTDLAAGTYTVTVNDNAGCILMLMAEVGQPDELVLFSTVVEPTDEMENGEISVTANGGTQPFTYEWSTGDTVSTLSNIGADQYIVIVTDAMGCTVTNTITLVDNPCDDTLEILEISDFVCFGKSDGSISVQLMNNGPTASILSYEWSNGDTEAVADTLPAGTYGVAVTATDNCTYIITEIVINEGNEVTLANEMITDESGTGNGDGSIVIDAAGGDGTFSYQWFDESNDVISTEKDLINIPSGTYFLCVTDGQGCPTLFGPFEVSVGTALEELDIQIDVYPNPANNTLHLESDRIINNISVYSITGHKLELDVIQNRKAVDIDVATLTIGNYILSYSINGLPYIKKIAIVR